MFQPVHRFNQFVGGCVKQFFLFCFRRVGPWTYNVLILPFVIIRCRFSRMFNCFPITVIIPKKGSASPSGSSNSNEKTKLLPVKSGHFPGFFSHESPPGRRDAVFTCHFGEHQLLYVYTVDIVSVKHVQMLVCSETPGGDSNWKIATELLKRGGEAYAKEKRKAFKWTTKQGDVLACQGGSTGFPWIAHAVPYATAGNKENKNQKQEVEKMYNKILQTACEKECKSVVLPFLGDHAYHAQIFYDALRGFLCSHGARLRLSIHLVNKDSKITDKTIEIFKRILDPGSADSKPRSLPTSLKQSKRSGRSPSPRQSPSPRRSSSPRQGTSPTQDTRPKQGQGRRSGNHGQGTPVTPVGGASSSSAPLYKVCDETHSVRQGTHTRKRSPYSWPDEKVTQRRQTHGTNGFDMNFGNAIDDEFEIITSPCDEGSHGSNVAAASSVDKSMDVDETCVICMDTVKSPKKLGCGHLFCRDCIDAAFEHKKACPSCGTVFGVIEGDQPAGSMNVKINSHAHCKGYERYGRIEITYTIDSGRQGPNHPKPGTWYDGIRRTAYLPDNKQGNQILKMLKIAFDRKLIFTIGNSRTTGKEGVITWNDIHHKTDPRPHTQFGYPDDTYLDRVTDELKAKGVTPADIADRKSR